MSLVYDQIHAKLKYKTNYNFDVIMMLDPERNVNLCEVSQISTYSKIFYPPFAFLIFKGRHMGPVASFLFLYSSFFKRSSDFSINISHSVERGL